MTEAAKPMQLTKRLTKHEKPVPAGYTTSIVLYTTEASNSRRETYCSRS